MKPFRQLQDFATTALFSAGALAMAGFLLLMPTPAKAAPVTIDEIIFEQDGSVNPAVLAGTADFSFNSLTSVLTIVLTNTSTGATGGAASTNLLTGIGFNLPGGLSILNSPATNSVAITTGSSAINFTAPISDSEWGAGNGALNSINEKTVLGDVNASAATLQAQIDFDLAGLSTTGAPPKANIDGPSFGLLTSLGGVTGATCGGLACVQNSVTLNLVLGGAEIPADLLNLIDAGHVVLSFGSPNTSTIPEPDTLVLVGLALVGLGWIGRRRKQRR